MSIESIKENPAIMGGSKPHQGERPRERTHKRHRPHRGNEERSQEAAEDRGRGTHPHQKGYNCALAEFKEGATDHTMMNTLVRVHTALQQHGKHGVGKDPHTGPMAFNAMRHNEEEKSMHNTHSKHGGKATRPSLGATKPRGRDQ